MRMFDATGMRAARALLACAAAAAVACAAPMNVLFFAVDDLRDQLAQLGPGVIGPGCGLTEGSGCTKMVG